MYLPGLIEGAGAFTTAIIRGSATITFITGATTTAANDAIAVALFMNSDRLEAPGAVISEFRKPATATVQ